MGPDVFSSSSSWSQRWKVYNRYKVRQMREAVKNESLGWDSESSDFESFGSVWSPRIVFREMLTDQLWGLWTSDFDIMEVLSGHSDFIEMREPYSKAAWVRSVILLDIWQVPNDTKISQNPFQLSCAPRSFGFVRGGIRSILGTEVGPYHTLTRNSSNASQWACATTKLGSGWWLATCSSPVITPRCHSIQMLYDRDMPCFPCVVLSLSDSLVFHGMLCSMLCTVACAVLLLCRSCARATPSPECGPQMDLWNLCSSSWRSPLAAKLSNAPGQQVSDTGHKIV